MQERNDIMSVDAMMDERYGTVARTEVDSSRRSAWTFTRLSYKGYPPLGIQ